MVVLSPVGGNLVDDLCQDRWPWFWVWFLEPIIVGFVELRDDLLDFRLIEICDVLAERHKILLIVAEPTFHVGFQLLDVFFHLFVFSLQVVDTRLDLSSVFIGIRHNLVDPSMIHF